MLNNYGAVLQAYALQRYIRNHSNHDVETIDFTTQAHEMDNKLIKIPSGNVFYRVVFLLLQLFHYPSLKRRKDRTVDFKKQYMRFSKRYGDMPELLSNPPQKDIYISGSDQVFNPNGEYALVYYLAFDKKGCKKVAYAPSFGIEQFNDTQQHFISQHIKDFDALSCRESVGAKFLSLLVGKEVPCVVDPTLLLSKDEWHSIAIKPKYNHKYIFVYDLNGAENLIHMANEIKKKHNLPIVCLTSKVQKFYKVDMQIYDAGPREFIGWIENAEYVITDSFHGTIFSLIFGKEFYTYIAFEKTSSRIVNLLKESNVPERIIRKQSLCNFSDKIDLVNPIDSTYLTSQKEYSKEFIKTNILE